jgi:hypothetical protein
MVLERKGEQSIHTYVLPARTYTQSEIYVSKRDDDTTAVNKNNKLKSGGAAHPAWKQETRWN